MTTTRNDTMPVYKVTVQFHYYAVGSSPEYAIWLANEAAEDVALEHSAFAQLIADADVTCPDDLDYLVYGADDEVTLREALASQRDDTP
jgi:hypothetical protein